MAGQAVASTLVAVATDRAHIVQEIADFYDFAGTSAIVVGAGQGQLVDYALPARRIVAVDKDGPALQRLEAVIRARHLTDRFDLQTADFRSVLTVGDVVVFEFCLHEMADPTPELDHARTLARDVIVVDHAPGSLWSWYAGEEAGVEAAWAAVEQAPIRKRRDVDGHQKFADFDELAARVASQGETSRTRIEALRDQRPIVIPMPYRLVLLGGRR